MNTSKIVMFQQKILKLLILSVKTFTYLQAHMTLDSNAMT